MPATTLDSTVPSAPLRRPLLRGPLLWRRLTLGAVVGGLTLILVAVPLWLGRQVLLHHLAERQAQVVQSLVLGLQTLPGEFASRLRALPAAVGGMGSEVQVLDVNRQSLAHWRQWRLPVVAPETFVDLMALPPAPARATVHLDGVGTVHLVVRAGIADLFDLAWQLIVAAWAGMAACVALTAGWSWQRQRRQQAESAARTDALLLGQQRLFDAQARQLDELRQRTHLDELTALPNRRHFLALFDEFLVQQGVQADAGLLLLRVHDLQGVNQRIGRASADRLLQALAQTLETYTQRISRCAAGRLNGADFALLLPAGGLAQETAESLAATLRVAFLRLDAHARVAIGAVELGEQAGGRLTAQRALALADAALAESEVNGAIAVHALGQAPATGDPLGEVGWQRRITRALTHGRVVLGEYPVCTPDGRRLLLDCPLRVQLSVDGPYQPAQRWLALAVRSRLSAQVDDKALALALAAIGRDGQARCVNMSAQSLASPEFVAGVSRRLEAAPDAACRLWIDIPESLALERPMLVRELSRHWRPLGAMLALEHAGEGLLRIQRLIDLGLDCVRIDGRFVNGLSEPAAEAARSYLQGLVRLVQSVGLQVTAEGVREAADLEVLWELGFDAATGPAVVALSDPPSDWPADEADEDLLPSYARHRDAETSDFELA